MKRLALIPVLLLATAAVAQIHGVPASVTSTNGNFRATFNPPASVTSLGPNGFNLPPCTGIGMNPLSPPCVIGGVPFRHHGHGGRNAGVFFPYAYPIYPFYDPYGYADYTQPPPPAPEPAAVATAPAPTIFDRGNGYGYASATEPSAAAPRPTDLEAAPQPAPSEPEEQETVTLVFRNGAKLDITNYAILGGTLFDLTPGHLKKKIALSELDVPATIKLNDERGVDFQLPKSHA